jgi:spore maturation protein SpmB
MASVWIESSRTAPIKLRGHLSGSAACAFAADVAKRWALDKPKRHALEVYGLTIGLFENSRMVGVVFIEPMSPPSSPEPGQPLRTKGAKQ